MSDLSPKLSHMEDPLAHYGVKGMKWGVRRTDAELSKSGKEKAPPTQAQRIAKEIGFASIGPAAFLLGAGPPVSIALGLSIGLARDPLVQKHVKIGAAHTANAVKSFGDASLSTMRNAIPDLQRRALSK